MLSISVTVEEPAEIVERLTESAWDTICKYWAARRGLDAFFFPNIDADKDGGLRAIGDELMLLWWVGASRSTRFQTKLLRGPKLLETKNAQLVNHQKYSN